uniref:Uncharacterized protein n=1 Tax=Anguilla anguilla TaxID=7936 RepID=A0A0E9SM44_ANGAN
MRTRKISMDEKQVICKLRKQKNLLRIAQKLDSDS